VNKDHEFKPTKKALELAESLQMEIYTRENSGGYDTLVFCWDENNMPEGCTVDDCIDYEMINGKLRYNGHYQMLSSKAPYDLTEELPLWISNNNELKEVIRFIAGNK
jgi:hypothetical protein